MNKHELVKKIEQFAPLETAEPWDCVGFMAETVKNEISKVMLCLTPVENVIKQALEQNCDMIVAHHPMFEVSINSCLVSKNLSPKIDIYCAHTNMDLANGGTTDTLISALDLEIQSVASDGFVRYVELTDPISVKSFNAILRKISPNLRYVNNNNQQYIHKIGFCAGSGSEFMKDVKQNDADCFVTGDLKFHTALDSEIVVYDIGHFESEILILPIFQKIIGKEVEIVFADEHSPFLV